jgi:hypothetical protein
MQQLWQAAVAAGDKKEPAAAAGQQGRVSLCPHSFNSTAPACTGSHCCYRDAWQVHEPSLHSTQNHTRASALQCLLLLL